MRKTMNVKIDKKMFKNTAQKTKRMNIDGGAKRGGIRL